MSCYRDQDGTPDCLATRWQVWGRWLLMGLIIAAIFACLILLALLRRRRVQRDYASQIHNHSYPVTAAPDTDVSFGHPYYEAPPPPLHYDTGYSYYVPPPKPPQPRFHKDAAPYSYEI